MSKKSVFREKSLERISSPEQLNDYIKVSSPSVWVILGALIIMILAVFIWSINGNITSEEDGYGIFQSSSQTSSAPDVVTTFVDPLIVPKLKEGMEVRIANPNDANGSYILGSVIGYDSTATTKSDIKDKFVSEWVANKIMEGNYGNAVVVKISKDENGNYVWSNNATKDESFIKTAEICQISIVLESFSPISLLLPQQSK